MVRFATPQDAMGILDIYGYYIEHSVITFEYEIPSVNEMKERIKKVLSAAPWLVFEENQKLLGYAYASEHRSRIAYRWTRELSAYVDYRHHGRGIASQLYQKLIYVIKKQGYCNALAGITLPNEKSVAFHEKFGFKPIGVYHQVGIKFDQFCDVGWWELPLSSRIGTDIKSWSSVI